jgi:hypothetical protein
MTLPRHRIFVDTDRTILATAHAKTSAVCLVHVDPDTARRYLDMHTLLPEGLTDWTDDALEELIEGFDTDHTDDCERTLFLLAHIGRKRACTLIWELARHLPHDLLPFAELAFAESLAWLGIEYLRDSPEERPTIRPA